MTKTIKVALLGATGKAGKYLLNALLEQDFYVKALIRKPENFYVKHPFLEIIKGDIQDFEVVVLLLQDCDVVISAIGPRKGEPLISSLATQHIVKVMNELNIKRYISLAGLNVDILGDLKSVKNQAASDWMKSTYPEAVADRQLAYDLMKNSNVDWTLIRLPWIEQTTERFGTVANLQDCVGERISTTDLADFVIEQIADEFYIHKAPFVASL